MRTVKLSIAGTRDRERMHLAHCHLPCSQNQNEYSHIQRSLEKLSPLYKSWGESWQITVISCWSGLHKAGWLLTLLPGSASLPRGHVSPSWLQPGPSGDVLVPCQQPAAYPERLLGDKHSIYFQTLPWILADLPHSEMQGQPLSFPLRTNALLKCSINKCK